VLFSSPHGDYPKLRIEVQSQHQHGTTKPRRSARICRDEARYAASPKAAIDELTCRIEGM
jgi:hypothetical protein